MISKTQFCFEETARYLFRRGPVWMWTITFKEVMTDSRINLCYGYFQKDIVRLFHGNIAGVRVYEVHPGGHGLHVHFLVNRFIPARLVWSLSRKHGLGIVDVVPADAGACNYLAKYLAKDCKALGKGLRRWASFGATPRLGVRNVVIESSEANYIRATVAGRKLPYSDWRVIAQQARMVGFRSADQTWLNKTIDAIQEPCQIQPELGGNPASK